MSLKFTATQESSDTLMKELKGKAEFFQQYIVDRYQKLVDQRSVSTNTEDEAIRKSSSLDKLIENCEESLEAKVSMASLFNL